MIDQEQGYPERRNGVSFEPFSTVYACRADVELEPRIYFLRKRPSPYLLAWDKVLEGHIHFICSISYDEWMRKTNKRGIARGCWRRLVTTMSAQEPRAAPKIYKSGWERRKYHDDPLEA